MRFAALLLSVALAAAGCGAVGTRVNPSLGSIVTRDHVVLVEQTPDGVRYSLETRSGDLVAENLTREELAAFDPRAAESLEQGTALDARVDLDASR